MIGVPDEKWGETVKALVVLAPGGRDRKRVHRALPIAHRALQVPDNGRVPYRAHRTATGKLQKFKLREPYWAGFERKVN